MLCRPPTRTEGRTRTTGLEQRGYSWLGPTLGLQPTWQRPPASSFRPNPKWATRAQGSTSASAMKGFESSLTYTVSIYHNSLFFRDNDTMFSDF
jgi:hypothetical protein